MQPPLNYFTQDTYKTYNSHLHITFQYLRRGRQHSHVENHKLVTSPPPVFLWELTQMEISTDLEHYFKPNLKLCKRASTQASIHTYVYLIPVLTYRSQLWENTWNNDILQTQLRNQIKRGDSHHWHHHQSSVQVKVHVSNTAWCPSPQLQAGESFSPWLSARARSRGSPACTPCMQKPHESIPCPALSTTSNIILNEKHLPSSLLSWLWHPKLHWQVQAYLPWWPKSVHDDEFKSPSQENSPLNLSYEYLK